MKLFKETIEFLTGGEFFTGLVDRLFALSVTIIFFIVLIFCFVYKPHILLYILIAGMLVLGWFMLYFIFPEVHEIIHAGKRSAKRFFDKIQK